MTTELKASELVKHLQKAIDENGDLPVCFTNATPTETTTSDAHPVSGLVTMLDDTDKPSYFMLGDSEMLDMIY